MYRLQFFLIIFLLLFCKPVFAETISSLDSDGDGLSDQIEQELGTDPNNPDSDGDGYNDFVEVKNGYNPLVGGKDRNVRRKVEVNLSTQTMDYFVNDVRIASILVSTGRPGFRTPTGTFPIIRKRPVVHYKGVGFDHPNTKWNVEFKKGFYIHGAYWHNEFGKKPMSGGCVNVAYKDMEAMYSFLSLGDKVYVYGKPPVTPLKLSKGN